MHMHGLKENEEVGRQEDATDALGEMQESGDEGKQSMACSFLGKSIK